MNEIIQELLHRVRRSGHDMAQFSIKDIRRSYKEIELKFSLKPFIEQINTIQFYTAKHDDYNKSIIISLDRKQFLESLN